eukprot:6073661-Prymnesium_polylepis.1
MKAIMKLRPKTKLRPPTNVLRLWIYEFVSYPAFDIFISVVIMCNIVQMACDFWGMGEHPHYFYYYHAFAQLFLNIYYLECVIKLVAFGTSYFLDNWCRFDFFLVVVSLLDQFAADVLVGNVDFIPPMFFRVLRVFRMFRILRMIKGAKGIKDLISTIILSMPALGNVGSMLVLIVFIYAVLGVQLFTFLAWGENYTDERNFGNVGSATLLLFQCITGDGWAGLMMDAMVIACFVALNLIVAVILENFTYLGSQNPDLVTQHDIHLFKE